jgi:hypothetical protein
VLIVAAVPLRYAASDAVIGLAPAGLDDLVIDESWRFEITVEVAAQAMIHAAARPRPDLLWKCCRGPLDELARVAQREHARGASEAGAVEDPCILDGLRREVAWHVGHVALVDAIFGG